MCRASVIHFRALVLASACNLLQPWSCGLFLRSFDLTMSPLCKGEQRPERDKHEIPDSMVPDIILTSIDALNDLLTNDEIPANLLNHYRTSNSKPLINLKIY
jgi:hypothetical protein